MFKLRKRKKETIYGDSSDIPGFWGSRWRDLHHIDITALHVLI